MADAIERFLSKYPDGAREAALALRELVRATLPDASEAIDAPARMIAYSVGPGYAGLVCTIIPSKTGVKLGIARGAALPDPRGLLTGAGKVHKHVAMKTAADVARPGVVPLLRAAVAARKRDL